MKSKPKHLTDLPDAPSISPSTPLPPIPKAVWLLGVTSFFTDVAGEIIYPLLPVFLTATLGVTPLFVGALEGMAESVAAITKLASGYLSDRWGKKLPFVMGGYALSGIMRPLIGLVSAPWQVFAIRFGDRLGKGIRGAPRDSWLAKLSTPETRGRNFGLHRAMDHCGAVIGPLIATAYLFYRPGDYRNLFLLTFIFGAAAFLATWFARGADESSAAFPNTGRRAQDVMATRARNWKTLSPKLRRYLGILLLFTLGNSSDAFLLLRLRDSGLAIALLPVVWAVFHVVKTAGAYWGGLLSDRLGRERLIVSGWILYAACYFAFAMTSSLAASLTIFMIYGLHFGLSEGPEQAMVADLSREDERGTAFGFYHVFISIGALPASILFGWIATQFNYSAAFAVGATFSLVASALLWKIRVGESRMT